MSAGKRGGLQLALYRGEKDSDIVVSSTATTPTITALFWLEWVHRVEDNTVII